MENGGLFYEKCPICGASQASLVRRVVEDGFVTFEFKCIPTSRQDNSCEKEDIHSHEFEKEYSLKSSPK